MKPHLLKIASKFIAWQILTIRWQIMVFGRFCPEYPMLVDVSSAIDAVNGDLVISKRDLPKEIRIGVAKLVVARRRGI